MLFSEFIDNTKLPANGQIYALYTCLEQLYMKYDVLDKADIYSTAQDISKIFNDIEVKWYSQASIYRGKLNLIRGILDGYTNVNNRQKPDKERK